MRIARICLGVVFLVIAVSRMFGQAGETGTILGSVRDTSGAAVSGATVVVTNAATGVVTRATTTTTGDYTVLSLIPGSYEVSCQAPGFSKEVVTGITLSVNQQARVVLSLKPGAVTESVQVTAQGVALDTDNAAISQLVSQQQVVELPVNGRNFFDLLSIGAGAVTTSGEQGSMRAGKGNAWSINGSRPEANTYFLDGMVNTDQALNTPSVVMSIDAIQEFKTLSGTYSAQYGFSANQVSVTTKSGTNDLHGTLFEFDRNDAFDAFQYNQTGQKQKLRKNQFGYVADGPVYIPFLYHGRNKTFWMANYEGLRQSTGGNNGFANVPDPTELAGNFTTPVIDPQTGQPFPGGGGFASVIPSSRFSRVASVTIANKYIPAPNCTTAGCDGNYRLVSVGALNGDQQSYRVDQTLGKFGRVFGRGTFGKYVQSGYGGVSGPISGNLFTETDTNWVASHTLTIRPNLINQFTFGQMDASSIQSGQPVAQSVVSALGFSGVFKTQTDLQRSYTNISFSNQKAGENLSGLGGPINAYTFSDNPMWQITDAVSYIHGAHALTIGGDFRKWHLYRDLATDFQGGITYADYATGNQVGDFLLGVYSAAQAYVPGPFSVPGKAGNLHDYRFGYFATYLQDDWKVDSNLTLNVGLRWDLRNVPSEGRNHMAWLDTSNAAGGMCIGDKTLLTDGIAPPGNGFYRYCGRTNPAPDEKYDFAPRVGGAYRINSKTVARSGFGIFWDGVEGREIDDSGDIYPYISRQSIQQITGQSTYNTTDSLFPVVSTPGPITAGPNGPDSFIAVIISEKPKNPFVTDWALSLEREISRNTTIEVNYIGTKGSRLLSRNNINQALPPQNPAACNVSPLPDNCTVNARKPYANFGQFLDSKWIGFSNYNGLDAKVEHRSGHATLTSVYTWAKSLDEHSAAAGAGNAQSGWQGFLNNHNPEADYGRSDFNVGNRFVTSFTYDLPVGRGQRFGAGMNRVVDEAVGGWKTAGIVTFQQGFPLSVGASDTGGLLDSFGVNRANQLGSASKLKFSTNPTTVAANDSALFTQPAFATFGNSARNLVNGPGVENFDLSLKKSFAISEKANFQFQVDGFDAFNHTNFNGVCLNVNCTTTYQGVSGVPSFGQLTGAAGKRSLQLSGKFNF
jgi:Carboxypeptidase regulatory-like domain